MYTSPAEYLCVLWEFWYNCYNVNQQNAHTSLKLQQCFNIRKLLHVSGLNGQSSGSAQLYKIIVWPCYHLQHGEMSSSSQHSMNTPKLQIAPINVYICLYKPYIDVRPTDPQTADDNMA
jgi:hypothetical protein